jgi:hypothetical protein
VTLTLDLPLHGFLDRHDVMWTLGTLAEANPLLAEHHYLGPIRSGGARAIVIGRKLGGPVVACQVWRKPTSRRLPNDGSWFELSRWCLTPEAGEHAGSRNHRFALPLLRKAGATTLVSYSCPSAGHTGALYRACNWIWAPTWVRLRPPPSGHGNWGTGRQEVKDRWVFHVTKNDPRREKTLEIDDPGAIRAYLRRADPVELAWGERSPYIRRYTDVKERAS